MCLDTIEEFFRKDKTMKKITSILLSLVLCFSMSANVFASEISTEQEPVSGKGQILRSTPNTAPLICGACNTQPEGLLTMA